ncbi:hypothetical protein G7Y89_g14637 [Cudoniella acicularis]|uniref:TFIIS N-terminal domain-containing protein n=1 Tax=Cudoniella acicularis TaxID=354080 RepID=A0A8H4R0K0_9HELO|nr:hypothetical protein G7Y89_g14637 [Cudoniella acicularis]
MYLSGLHAKLSVKLGVEGNTRLVLLSTRLNCSLAALVFVVHHCERAKPANRGPATAAGLDWLSWHLILIIRISYFLDYEAAHTLQYCGSVVLALLDFPGRFPPRLNSRFFTEPPPLFKHLQYEIRRPKYDLERTTLVKRGLWLRCRYLKCQVRAGVVKLALPVDPYHAIAYRFLEGQVQLYVGISANSRYTNIDILENGYTNAKFVERDSLNAGMSAPIRSRLDNCGKQFTKLGNLKWVKIEEICLVQFLSSVVPLDQVSPSGSVTGQQLPYMFIGNPTTIIFPVPKASSGGASATGSCLGKCVWGLSCSATVALQATSCAMSNTTKGDITFNDFHPVTINMCHRGASTWPGNMNQVAGLRVYFKAATVFFDQLRFQTMRELRSRRIEATSPAKTRHMKNPGQQPFRAMGTANDQSNPASASDDPAPGAANVQAASTNEDTVIGETIGKDSGVTNPAAGPDEGTTVTKEKKILFLRHKLQKGLLSRDQDPKEDDMAQVSEYLTTLEGYADLEIEILQNTKINKVLKAVLKLNSIPKEETFHFKHRSQTLLEKWNQLLAAEQSTPATVLAASVYEDTAMVEAPADPFMNTAGSLADPVEAANESAIAAATADEDISMNARNNEAAANDSAPNEIEDDDNDDNDEELPEYIWSYFQGLEDEEDSNNASDDNLTSDNVPPRTFRPWKSSDRHYQQRDLHVEHVAMVLDRVLAQVQGRIGEFNIHHRGSLEDFLSSELDASGVTVGVLNWLITKHISKYRMELSRSLRQVRDGRVCNRGASSPARRHTEVLEHGVHSEITVIGGGNLEATRSEHLQLEAPAPALTPISQHRKLRDFLQVWRLQQQKETGC